MRNLIEYEMADIKRQLKNTPLVDGGEYYDFNDKTMEEYNKVKKLMDAKELKDPLRVFKRIEPDLDNPIVYKEYIKKFRNNPKYYEPDHDDEMHWIDFSKYKQYTINSLNDSLVITDEESLDYLLEDIVYSKAQITDLFAKINSYNLESSEYKEKFEHIIKNLKLFYSSLEILDETISKADDSEPVDKYTKLYHKQLNKMIHYLQAI